MGQTLTFRSFVLGRPSAPVSTAAPSPWQAVPLTALIVIAAQLVADFAFQRLTGIDIASMPGLRAGSDLRDIDPASARVLIEQLLIAQAGSVGLTLLVARYRGLGNVLRLRAPEGGRRAFVFALLLLFALLPLILTVGFIGTLIAPEEMAKDDRFFRTLAGSGTLEAALAIGLGASLSEELLFRGYLLTSLGATRISYGPAAILATLAWTGLHWGISWVGLLEVFLLGLYFSWLLWRTGSLWPLLVCHAAYNTSQLVWFWFGPA